VSLFVDIRVHREDTAAAVQMIVDGPAHVISRLLVDPAPPASGPEVELTIVIDGPRGRAAAEALIDALQQRRVSVLAWRAREWERA